MPERWPEINIGDLFWKARIDGSKIGMEATKAGAQAGTKFGRAMQGPMAAQVKQGFGLGGGIAAFNVVGMAITKVTGYLSDSADAFRAEEVSVQKLGTSLEANVDGWDGNTRAIERVLAARLTLGFSDDEQRASLALLVAATGDVTKALDIQRTAMDLARLKGISLAEASEALIKVEAGSFRILKSLGIELKEGATQTEALAAVQAVAEGQAEDYAQTLEGKLVVAEVKAAEASEKFGKSIAQLQAVALPALAEVITDLATQFDFLQVAADESTPALDKNAAALAWVKTQGLAALPIFQDLIKQAEAEALAAEEASGGLERMRGGIWGAGKAAGGAAPEVEDLTVEVKSLEDQARDAENAIDDLTRTIIEDLWGEAVAAGREQELRDQIRGVKEELAETTDRGDAIILKGQIAELTGELFELHLEQAERAGPEAAIAFLKKEQARAGDASGAIQRLIDKYRALAGIQGSIGPIIPRTSGIGGGREGPGDGRAHGGPVAPYTAYRVGERGEETLVMGSQPGYVLPDPMASTSTFAGLPGSGSSVSSSVTNVNVQLPGLLRAETPSDVVRSLRHLNVYGTFGDER